MNLRITPAAYADIDAILAYLPTRSSDRAARVAERLDAVFALLVRNPRLGRRTSNQRVRRLVIPRLPYLVFYEVQNLDLVIIAVRHAARRPGSMPGS